MKETEFISSILERIPDLDVEYAVDAMGGSESLYEKTLLHMVRQIPLNIGEMDDFLIFNDDLGAFAIKTHGIKSALRHVGKMALANEAESLEKAAKAGNKKFCLEWYDPFKEELLRFFHRVNEVAGQLDDSEEEQAITKTKNIKDFTDSLKQAGEAADNCDSISAYEILLPLTKMRFDGDIDDLIANAANALDQFKPYEALEYINKLLNK